MSLLARPGVGRLSAWVVMVALTQFVVLVATSTRYGYHGDEMYFIAAGSHPAAGYPDQPPIVPMVAWAMSALVPHSLVMLRLPSAVVSSLTTVVAAVIAREVGGKGRAQVIAAACTAGSGFALAVGHMVSTTTFDMLSTTLLLWCVIRAVMSDQRSMLLAAGLVTGIGCEAKPQVAVVAAVVLAALAVVGPRWPLSSWWLWAGVALAVLIAAPYLVWQARHGWPQLTVAQNVAGSAEGGRIGFIPFQVVMVSLFLVPVWVAGLVAPLRRGGPVLLRFLPMTYAGLAVLYLAADGKAYYLASLYPTLLAVGSVPVAAWLSRGRRWLRRGALGVAIALTLALNVPVALPVLPADQLQGSLVMALNPDQGETVGWPAFISTVTAVWRGLPPSIRARTAIFTFSYSEAGAVDLMGPSQGLPRAYSGHNGFSEWGQPPERDRTALLLGYDGPADAAPYFRQCKVLAHIDNHVGLDNSEQGLPVMVCHPHGTWQTLWPHLRHYE
ncbi:MAG: hypothetical protein QOI06_1376 [Nocardioidaceae bacterium]|nr:hypothetical protein [Nocardioidaceae bacterium]